MTPTWTLHGILPTGVPLPTYLRMTQRSRFSKKAKRYHQQRGAVGALIRERLMRHPEWKEQARRTPIIAEPYRIALVITMPPVKSGPNKGNLPANGGDLDNYYKSLNDALVKAQIVPDDCPRWHRGHGTIRGREGIYLGDRLSFTWALMSATRTEALMDPHENRRSLDEAIRSQGVRIAQALHDNQRLQHPGWEERAAQLEEMMRELATWVVEEGGHGQ